MVQQVEHGRTVLTMQDLVLVFPITWISNPKISQLSARKCCSESILPYGLMDKQPSSAPLV